MPKTVSFLCGLLFMMILASSHQTYGQSEETSPSSENGHKYVRITQPFANIYKELDPKSDVIREAKKGESLPLVQEGNSWFKVRVNENIGWIEKGAGKVIDDPSQGRMVPVTIFILVLLTAVIVTIFYIQRQKQMENE